MNSRRRMTGPLFNYLVGADQQGGRNGEPERPGGLHVDVQLDFRGLLDWQVCGLFALENAAGVAACETKVIRPGRSVTHQAARRDRLMVCIDHGHPVACRQRHDLWVMALKERAGADKERRRLLLDESCESRLEIAFSAGIQDQKLQAERARCRLRFCECGLDDRPGGIAERGSASRPARAHAAIAGVFLSARYSSS